MPPSVTIHAKVDGLDKLQAAVRKAGPRAQLELVKAMERSVTAIERDAKRNIRANKTLATGDLWRSISRAVVATAGRVVGTVGSRVTQSRFIEEGRGPGPVPIAPIIAWVKRKGLVRGTTKANGARGANRVNKNTVAQETRVAYAIARKIAAHGYKARPFMSPAWQANRANVRGYFQQAHRNILRIVAGRQ